MGKTGLIKHTFHQNKDKNINFIYVDIYQTTNLAEFTKQFVEAVLTQKTVSFSKRIWKEILSFFAAIRPTMTIDPMTGMPQCQVYIQPQTEASTLEQVFKYLESSDKQSIVAFDEFQVVADYKDCRMEAVLRTHIQQLHNVHFIFAGSKQHIMSEMFLAPNRPFFQSTQMMNIAEINPDVYYEFSARHFEKHHQHITKEVFYEMYDLVKGHTFYVQCLLNRTFQKGTQEIVTDDIWSALGTILDENASSYQMYCNLIPQRQREILKAIAKEGTVEEISSGGFLNKYSLGSSSTARSAVNALLDKELIYEQNRQFSVYDRFFSLWLKYY